ncbi:MAG TPA: NAD(+) diphosphatase [Streptosporangiaceae bacterium]
MAGSHITVPGAIALTRHEVERTTHRRTDTDWLARAWADQATQVLVVQDGQVLARIDDGGAELVFVSPDQAPEGDRFLLGVDDTGVAYFGVSGSLDSAHGAAGPAPEQNGQVAASGRDPGGGSGRDPGLRRAGLREAGTLLTDRDAGLLTHAVALANWHAVAGFCPRCGSVTRPEQAGHSRRCTADGSEHFPRSDPAVIMSVTDPDDRLLLARNAQWPTGRVSVLAGFVEPGESAEQAVAREVHEETGVVVAAVTYAGSQPWPMPHNLMLGFRASSEGTAITVDGEEIAEARWYSRDDLRQVLESGVLKMPPSLSISRWLIETWYGSGLPRPAR